MDLPIFEMFGTLLPSGAWKQTMLRNYVQRLQPSYQICSSIPQMLSVKSQISP